MKLRKLLCNLAINVSVFGLASNLSAAVSPEAAQKLGNELTPFGAIKAGNDEGTIPPYEGGLRTAPEGFEPGDGYWINPFKDEEPRLRIDASNYQRSEEHTSELQSRPHLVCRLLLEKKKIKKAE